MDPALAVRPARADDFATLAPPIAALPVFAPYKFTARALQQRWEEALGQHAGMEVAEQQGVPVGLSWYLPRGAFAGGAYLRFLSVVPEASGQGVGALLLQGYEKACAGAPGGLFVLTSHHNTAGAAFYSKHGYARVGSLPEFAVAGVTELIFWKPPRRTAQLISSN